LNASQHAKTLVQMVLVWLAFWLLGLPDYYQQYSPAVVGSAAVLLSVVISLVCFSILVRTRPERRVSKALWLSIYYTVPFAVLDTLYCGIYLGHGASYLWKYWYLTVFYVSPWITLLPVAALLRNGARPFSPSQ
jgi:Ca2+/Na+ antiporter